VPGDRAAGLVDPDPELVQLLPSPADAETLVLRNVHLVGHPSTAPVDVVVDGGTVVSVDTLQVQDRSRQVVDLDGRHVMRGLWDHHVHFNLWALARRRLDVSPATSAAAAATMVGTRLAEAPPASGQVLVGYGFRDATWADRPSLAGLDAVAPETAVVLASADLHCYWLNSTAFGKFGLPRRDDGLLRENAMHPVSAALEEFTPATIDAWVNDAAADAAARGVVGVVELEQASNVDAWSRRVAAGNTYLRVACGVYEPGLQGILDRGLRTGDVLPGTHGLVTMGPLKLITDGSLNTRTAYCCDPYPDLEGLADSHGILVLPPDQLVPLMRRAAAAGLACAVHAIGDRANMLALDAFETVGCAGSIEHAQLLVPSDLERFAELGIVASVQPAHALDDRDVADRHWAGRTDRAFPYASLRNAGAMLRLGSDAPVAPLDPWVTIAAAVERTDDDRPSWHPEQEIPVAAALDASTQGRAAVQVGDVADLVVTDLDPTVASADVLRTMPVHGTLLEGRWTWLRDQP